MRTLLRTATLLASSLLPCAARADELRFAGIFSDHMVLQRDQPLRVWGRAAEGATVTVEIAGQRASARAAADGRWSLELPAIPAGGPHELRASGGGEAVLRDVHVGEVWLCSGQSNMAFPLAASTGGPEERAALEALDLRLFTVPMTTGDGTRDVEGRWRRCAAADADELSAVAYYFARERKKDLGCAIGIVQAAVGGTPAEAWTDLEAMRANEALAPSLARPARAAGSKPGALFGGMIAPIAPLSLRGVLWYQGESNAGFAEQYALLFPTLIRSWRRAFAREDLPFLFVQLPGFGTFPEAPEESDWAELREAQRKALALEHTGMVVTLDLGDEDIHPPRKREIGERLAALARAKLDRGEDVSCLAPVFADARVEGSRVVVAFTNAAGGLSLTEGERAGAFAIAGADGRFAWADARVDGETVVLTSDAVSEPVSVRYAWSGRPRVILVGPTGLPAAPFRAELRRR